MARILIVDDSPTETFRFREILTKHGYEVLEATNGADGVTMAQAELPDLVLMDVVMPGMNGLELMKILLKCFPGDKNEVEKYRCYNYNHFFSEHCRTHSSYYHSLMFCI